jgi:hypothetical protein
MAIFGDADDTTIVDENPFPLEKIISVPKNEYLSSVGKTDADYNFVGVSIEGEITSSIKESLSKRGRIPTDAERVVDYQVHFFINQDHNGCRSTSANAYGTALVPKENKPTLSENTEDLYKRIRPIGADGGR